MEALLHRRSTRPIWPLWKPPRRGCGCNPLKCSQPQLEAALPFALEPTAFSPLSYAFAAGEEGVGRLPAHHAGLFYVQEPSACSAVTVLAPQPGEKVLDLCAAPGGKSTQIAGLLAGEGLLWSNEIVKSRAQVLLSNVERLVEWQTPWCPPAIPSGCAKASRASLTRCWWTPPAPERACSARTHTAIAQWSPESPAACAQRQRAF